MALWSFCPGGRGARAQPFGPRGQQAARGKEGGPKRTPKHLADPDGQADEYTIGDIIATNLQHLNIEPDKRVSRAITVVNAILAQVMFRDD